MKIGIMQPYFFPYLGYWQLINAVDKYVVYDDVNYIKRGWIARNNILLNGKAHLITLPLIAPSQNKLISQTQVTEDLAERKKVLKTIQGAYSKAPYYDKVMPMLEEIILDSRTIADLNYKAAIKIADYLGMNTEIILSSSLDKDSSLKGQDKILYINKLLGSTEYYNAIGGTELYDRELFEANGMNLHFLKMGDVVYKQFDNEFVPYLSIIDLLMFCSAQEAMSHLNNYTLI